MNTISVASSNLTDADKFRELVIYISLASETDPKFGSIKLNKILFYADFSFYLETGSSITGQEYQKLKRGPAPRLMKPLLDDLIGKSDLILADREYFGRPQKRPIALRQPDLSKFSVDEIAMVDSIIRDCLPFNGSEISEVSHDFPGWKLANDGETIPYASALLDPRPLTDLEKAWANDIDMTGIQELLGA